MINRVEAGFCVNLLPRQVSQDPGGVHCVTRRTTSTTLKHRIRCPWSRSTVRNHKRTLVADKQIRDL
ncbi:hypothetical protein AGOR_G00148250 [Albula goreensis]|uniref:Uncharacterized protein n=1 Tax=Albula goreensis TaxID=1534307 RepID=A0A8T3D8D3_9TELE|nr:hypothetical protein AGOR_G00148250 [Albula goreensis]